MTPPVWDPQPGVLSRQHFDATRYRSPYLFEFAARDGWTRDRDSGLWLSRSGHLGTFARTATKTVTDSNGSNITVPPYVPGLQVTEDEVGVLLSSADVLWWAFHALPRALEVTVSLVDRNPSADEGIVYMGNDGNSGARFWIEQGASVYEVHHHNGTSEVTGLASGGVATGEPVVLRARLNPTGSVQLWQSIDGGAETTGGASGTLALAAAWSDERLYFNARGGGNDADSEIRYVRVAAI